MEDYHDKIEREKLRMINVMHTANVGSDAYRAAEATLMNLQKIDSSETERVNAILELKRDEKRIAIDNEKLELESMRIENERVAEEKKLEDAKKERKSRFWGSAALKAIGIGGAALVFAVLTAISNSGVVLPKDLMRFIDPKSIF